jgi:heme-binding protein
MSNTSKVAGIVVAVFVVAVAATQVIRPESADRPTDSSHTIQAQPGTPGALAAVLSRSCGDCHSNTMVSRWYTRVPPFSMLMARGASEGRKAINFSEWTGYSAEQQRDFLLASCTDATLGKMPVKAYLRFRRDAELSTRDVETICSATRQVEQTQATSATRQARREP